MNCSFSATNLRIFGRAVYSLAKLPGEELYFDAQPDGLFLRTLNSSRSAFGCFKFCPSFFLVYVPGKDTVPPLASNGTHLQPTIENEPTDLTSENRCKIPTKSALIIYKTINNLEKTIDTCDLRIDIKECRLKFRLNCKYGVVRTYNFVLIECDSVETLYDRTKCKIQLVTPSTLILDAIQTNFKGGQEDLTFNVSETELLISNCLDDEPDPDKCVKTQMRLNSDEFDAFAVNEPSEVTFCLKELRSFLAFIETFRLPVSIYFDQSGKPVIFALESDPNFTMELILATYLIQDMTETKKIDGCSQQNATINNSTTNQSVLNETSKNAASDVTPAPVNVDGASAVKNRMYKRKKAAVGNNATQVSTDGRSNATQIVTSQRHQQRQGDIIATTSSKNQNNRSAAAGCINVPVSSTTISIQNRPQSPTVIAVGCSISNADSPAKKKIEKPKNGRNGPTAGDKAVEVQNEPTVEMNDPEERAEDDVLSQSPLPKRPRHLLLVKGWSQSTTTTTFDAGHHSTLNDNYSMILAADSDMEDH